MSTSFITWHPHCRRSDALAAALGGASHLIHYLGFKRPWQAPLKYLPQTLTTIIRLLRDKPSLLLVATPPVVAALPVYLYARIMGVPFIIDAHTGVFDNPRWIWMLWLSRYLSCRAAATIVTNQPLAQIVESWGARAIVIGDLPVTFAEPQAVNLGDGCHIAVINTFAADEPISAIVAAARKIPYVTLHVTGELSRAPRSLQETAPPNVHFTGWLTEEQYVGLLMAVTGVMVLTTRNHTMQRGAYEAMALNKPLITSGWPLLRQTFSRGTVHVDNSIDGITAGLETLAHNHLKLAAEMQELRCQRHAEFAAKLDALQALLKDHGSL